MNTLDSAPENAPAQPVLAELSRAGRILQKERAACSLLRSWPWVFGAILTLLVLDVVLHLGPVSRVIFDALILAGLLALLARGAVLAWRLPPSLEAAARQLEGRDPGLGSRVINLLQIRAQCCDGSLSSLTRAMAAQAVESYSSELSVIDFSKLARTDEPRRQSRRAAFGLAGFALALLAFWEVTRTEAPRFFDPLGDHPPFSLTRLEIVEPAADGALVIYGQALQVDARTSGHRPGELFLSAYPPGQPAQAITLPMFEKGARGFSQQLENLRADRVIYVHTKNHHSESARRRVTVSLTPKLDAALVRIVPPAYTGLSAEERPLVFKNLKALEGSTLEFRLTSNRPLRSGRLEIFHSPETADVVELKPGEAENEVHGRMTVGEAGRLRFSLVDGDGHPSSESWELSLSVTHDLPPEVQITTPREDGFVASDYRVEAIVEASDDYGLSSVRLHQARNNVWSEPRITRFEKPPLHARETLVLDLQKMHVAPGDTLTFFAEAIDNAPEAHLARSRTITLTVITPDQYNEFLREQLDVADVQAKYSGLISQMRDLAAAQQKLGAASAAARQALEKASVAADEKARAAAEQKLDQLLDEQSALNGELNALAQKMETAVRDKPVYDLESELKESLKEEAGRIRESSEANKESTQANIERGEAGQKDAASSKERLTDFERASQAQAERLGEAAEETRENVVEPLADLSLMQEIVKDLNRFKELAAAQEQLAQHAKPYDKTTPLGREDQLALKDLGAQQKAIGDELDAVEQKLWEDGKAAKEKFPKAGESAKDIAQKMGDARLQMHAQNATEAMLAAQGDKSAQLSARMRDEMNKLFGQCNAKDGPMSQELDHAMGLSRGMKPGRSFSQMQKSRKFGPGKPGFGQAQGTQAAGQASSGSALVTGPNASVLGNETAVSHDSARPGSHGKEQGRPGDPHPELAHDPSDTARALNPVNRESDAVQGEPSIEQYNDVVEKYFKAITR